MPIPESQLNTWSNRGATESSADAYASIKYALEKSDSPVANLDIDIYLQGSYRNATNIYGDSDVDVVVQFNSTFQRDLSTLDAEQLEIYGRSYSKATYLWEHFRTDVIAALNKHYGASKVTPDNKSIKVKTGAGRPADVIPALHYRFYKYHYGRGSDYESFVDGIHFKDSAGKAIVNYPKLHISNGESKNGIGRTNGAYKPGVRMFKNARNRLIDEGAIPDGSVPSYFLECLLYNVPDSAWTSSPKGTFIAVVSHLLDMDLSACQCQNGRLALMGPSSTQWNADAASHFVIELVDLWKNWYS